MLTKMVGVERSLFKNGVQVEPKKDNRDKAQQKKGKDKRGAKKDNNK